MIKIAILNWPGAVKYRDKFRTILQSLHTFWNRF